MNTLAKSAVAASDLVLIPVQPSPFDLWAARDILDILEECSVIRPDLRARFVVNRLFVGTKLGAEVGEALAELRVPALQTAIRNRTEYAKAVRNGRTAIETAPPRGISGFSRTRYGQLWRSRDMPPTKWGIRPGRTPERKAGSLNAFVRARRETKRLNADIPAALHVRVKAGCALEGRDMTEVLIELLEQRFPEKR